MYNITFRPLIQEDLPLLDTWLAASHVDRWWQDDQDDSLQATYHAHLAGQDTTEIYVIQMDGHPIGIIQLWRVADAEEWAVYLDVVPDLHTAAGIDFLIGEERLTGKGIGSGAIRDFAVFVFGRYPDIDTIVADPEQENIASWRALEKAGFQRVWAGELPTSSGPSFLYRKDRTR